MDAENGMSRGELGSVRGGSKGKTENIKDVPFDPKDVPFDPDFLGISFILRQNASLFS